MELKIIHFYPDLMSLYGSYANVAVLRRYLEALGNTITVETVVPGQEADLAGADFLFMGAGTERSQKAALADFLRYGEAVKTAAESGVTMLFAGTAMELLGQSITDDNGKVWEGIGLALFTSVQGKKRFVEDVYGHTDLYAEAVVGFMNKCSIIEGVETPLLTDLALGFGNSGEKTPEGFRFQNVLASELTGPLLVKNPRMLDAVAAAIRRKRAGISEKRKPVSFIFVGPTGVGKTELVKQLATDLFNTPDALIRLDMSEFMEKHSVSRIVGSPPGYVGYDEAGQLTEKIRRKPYAVILFDEIEKAHPDVLNVLLQILDDGEITDAHGRKVNFENTIIVMTSNAGSATKEGTVGFDRSVSQQDQERAMKALQQFLRPEFINRVDAVICFNLLTEEHFQGIARIMLNELAGSLKEKGNTFTYDDALVAWLTHKSYSLTYGARNLRRTIQKEVEDPMATKIIDSYENPITQVKATVEDEKVRLYTL